MYYEYTFFTRILPTFLLLKVRGERVRKIRLNLINFVHI